MILDLRGERPRWARDGGNGSCVGLSDMDYPSKALTCVFLEEDVLIRYNQNLRKFVIDVEGGSVYVTYEVAKQISVEIEELQAKTD